MDEQTFQLKYLEKIKNILDFAINNSYSDFYRKKYKGLGIKPENIKNYEDFQKIPFLTKDEILETPLEERLFFPSENITHYAFSSGTVNQKKPLVCPHAIPENFEKLKHPLKLIDDEQLKRLGTKNYIIIAPIFSSPFAIAIVPNRYATPILGDTTNLKLSAIIAKEVSLSGIMTNPAALQLFADQLQEVGFDKRKIKWIVLFGEMLSHQKFKIFKNQFPNAYIEIRYGNTENVNGYNTMGYWCKFLNGELINTFHILTSVYFIETISENGQPVAPGQSGEIVDTSLVPRAFPFIRYRHGDVGVITRKKCRCGNDDFLEIIGHENYNELKYHGTIIHTKAIDTAMENVEDLVEPWFQMHVWEEMAGDKLMPKLKLNLLLKNKSNNNEKTKSIIQKTVSHNLFLTMNKTLENLVENKTFLPLEIEFLDSIPKETGKAKQIISHLN